MSPAFEMPMEELEAYAGRNPRPADFDSYWATALEEMAGVDPDVSLTEHPLPADFAECYDLWFTGVRGARIHAKYLRPRNSVGPHPAVLAFHGYSVDSGDWVDKLPYVAKGYSVAALDCRGQAGRSEDPGGVRGNTWRGHIIRGLGDSPENLLFRHVFLDCAQLARIIMAMPDVDESRVGVIGSSQGGGLALACAALEPRIKRAAPVYPFLCDYKRVWEMGLGDIAYEEVRTYFRQFDPLHAHEDAIFTRLGYIDVQHLAPRIAAETLMTVCLMDQVCPPSTQFAAYNKIVSAKEMIIYPDYAHEALPGQVDRSFTFMAGL